MNKRRLLLRVVLTLILFCTNVGLYAYDFESDGIYYNLNHNEKTAAVTSKGNNERYTGILVIPKSIRYNGVTYRVTSIGSSAFYCCSELTSITIPNSVTSIGDYAFGDCSGLTSVTIPNSVTSIGADAFFYCTGLTSVTIPNSVTSIRWGAFSGCSGLVSIAVSSGNTKYDSRNNCNAIIETSSNTLIIGCKNTIIPNSVRSIGLGAFAECSSLTSITIPNSVTSINNSAFIYCRGLTSITIPNSVTSIGDKAFWACSRLSSVIIGYSVTSIGRSAFYGCSELTSITIPNSVTSIGDDAFYGCNGLTSVISEIQNPFDISNKVFYGIPTYAILLVPKGTKSKYEAFSGWKMNFKEIVEAEDSRNYDLTISSSGYGSVSYNGASIRDCSQTFIVEEGTNTTVTFTPDNGYRIASVKLNNTDVTSSVSNNKYTINNITQNTTLKVTFEAIPLTTYTLSITASGNGSVTFNSTTVKNKTQSFTVNEGTNVTVLFTPDNGYRIASVKVNNTDVTSSVSNNKYIISNISANATLKVTFEAIPATTYSLSITVSGNGSASYNSTTFRNNTLSFTVNEGASATITFTPDSEYLVARVKVNNTDVTSSVSNNQYVISNIIQDTSLEVEFEKESSDYDITQHISAYNIGGSVTQTNDLINSGSQLNWTFSNDSEYSVTFKSMQLIDGKTGVEGNVMTVDNVVEAGTSVSYSTTIGASGIHIPVTCRFRYVFNGNEYYTDAVYSGTPDSFTLSINTTGNGEVSYDGKIIRNSSETFSVRMMSSPTLSFTPDNGCCVKSLLVNNKDVTSGISNNRYTLGLIMSNTSVEVVFEEIMDALTVDGVNYSVTSQNNRTVTVVDGTYGQVLTVPETVVWKGSTWTVIGIDNDALKNSKELAAVIWNPAAAFTATVSNPNLLLYVKKEEYAPLSVQNVVVNGTASNVVLKEATSGNNFYCPQSFVAQKISFTHNYQMQTGIGESRGWETIALPFDVQSITHQTVGAIKPFAKWKSGDSEKPFWLYELTGTGWNEADGIKAYTPYIISMPNNSQYDTQWVLKGNVTFAASNVTVDKTENVNMPSYRERTFVPCYANQEASADIYALNVKNDYVTNSSNMTEGSWFVQNLRQVHPFEAYMTSSSQAQEFFGVLETGIETIDSSQEAINRFYDLQGRMVQGSKLPKGVYILNGKKMLIK